MSNEPTQPTAWEGWYVDRNQWHFYRRLYERYDIILSRGEIEVLMDEIRHGRALMIASGENENEAVYSLKCQGKTIRVAANATFGKFLTAFPPNAKHGAVRTNARRGTYPGKPRRR